MHKKACILACSLLITGTVGNLINIINISKHRHPSLATLIIGNGIGAGALFIMGAFAMRKIFSADSFCVSNVIFGASSLTSLIFAALSGAGLYFQNSRDLLVPIGSMAVSLLWCFYLVNAYRSSSQISAALVVNQGLHALQDPLRDEDVFAAGAVDDNFNPHDPRFLLTKSMSTCHNSLA